MNFLQDFKAFLQIIAFVCVYPGLLFVLAYGWYKLFQIIGAYTFIIMIFSGFLYFELVKLIFEKT